MIPKLFRGDSTSFGSLGLGGLTRVISCNVVEELNGAYELNMTILQDDPLFEFIKVGNIIVAEPNMTDQTQPFVIESVTKNLNGEIEVYATHIVQYRTRLIPFDRIGANTLNAAVYALNNTAKESNPFTITTDKTSSTSFNTLTPRTYRDLMGGSEGSLLDVYGGEYYYDRFNIKLLNRRGRDTGARVMYGRNMTDFSEETLFAWNGSATGVLGFFYKEDLGIVIGDIVYSEYAGQYPYKRTVVVDFTDKFEDAETLPTQADVNAMATDYIHNKGLYAVTLECAFDQFDTTDAEVNTIQLGDTVTVINPLYKVNYQSRIVATDYNVLSETYNSLTVGDLKTSINDAIADSVSSSAKTTVTGGGGGTTDYNALTNKPKINGVTLQGDVTIETGGDVNYYGTCTTAGGTAAKTATITGFPTTLTAGQKVSIRFTYANTVANPTLSINGGTAIAIKRYGTTAPSTSAASSWMAGSVVNLTYDGSYWIIDGWLNTTYSAISQANIEATAGTSAGLITGQRFTQGLAKRTDTAMSDTSENPVQNKAIKSYIDAQMSNSGNYYGVCSTGTGVAAKTVAITGFPSTLATGQKVSIKFEYANFVANATLSINGGTAVPIMKYGTSPVLGNVSNSWNAGSIVEMTYDGTNWIIDNFLNDYNSAISQANIEDEDGTVYGLISGTRFTQGLNARLTSITTTEIDTITS